MKKYITSYLHLPKLGRLEKCARSCEQAQTASIAGQERAAPGALHAAVQWMSSVFNPRQHQTQRDGGR